MADSAPVQFPQTSLKWPRFVASPWIVLIVVALGFFMILLDTTIVNVAIPSMIDGLHASLDQILWVLNAYILVYAVLLITAGRLGDMWGPKKLFMAGLVIFIASSAACGLAQSPDQLILFRIIQGIGGAILTPQSLSIITSIFPPEKRGAAFGVWGGVAGLAAATGPTLGGFLTTAFSWRAIFFVNVPIGILAFILAWLLMPELTNHRAHRLDIIGVILASAGLFSAIFALIEGQRYSWGRISNIGAFNLGSIQAGLISIPSLLVYGVILLILFVVWEARQDEPILPLSLFRDRNFSVANAVSAIVAFGLLGLFLPLTIFLQSVLGMTALQAGVAFVPTSLVSMFIAPVAGRLSDKINGKYILFAGLIFFAVGMGLVIVVASLGATGTTFTFPLIVAGIGMGCTFAPMVTLAMRNIAPVQAGSASGFINTIRQVGGTIGSAVVGALLQNRLATELHTQAVRFSTQLPVSFRSKFISGFSHAGKSGLQVGRGQTGSGNLPHNLPASVAHQLQSVSSEVFRHAFLNAMKPSLALPIAVLALGALVTLLMRGQPSNASEERREPEPAERAAASS
ncbi:MAG: DHA2 family efflux MFS transporter permease subunit [Chloroflexota bacterium]|nr:DHA2 family efflux MFS transporter permease subunit [Chloroflexota bacterium]